MPDITDVPTKRSSRRRPSSAPEAQETTAADAHAAVVPPVAVPEPETISAPAAIPEVPATIPPAVVSVAAAPSPRPAVILREPGTAPATQPATPPAEPTLPNSPFRRHDVVQVLDTSSRHYGQFFSVGDVQHKKVHGYCMMPGGHKEFITIELAHCWYIGSAKIRSATPVSPKWISDNNRA